MTDPIADMLNRLRTAAASGRSQVVMPYSKLKAAIAAILAGQGYIASFKVEGKELKSLVVELGGAKPITKLDRVSRPGHRIYAGASEIPQVLNGRGLMIVSTSGGLMTGREAKQKGLGGELICKVW